MATSGLIAVFFVHGFLFASWTAHIPQLQHHLGLERRPSSDSPCSGPLSARSWRWWWPPASYRWWEARRWCAWPFSATASRDRSSGSPVRSVPFFLAFLLWGFFQGMLDVSMNTQAITVERFSGRVLMPGFHGSWSTGALVGAVTGAAAVGLGLSLSEQLLVLAVPCLLVVGWLTTWMIPDRRGG